MDATRRFGWSGLAVTLFTLSLLLAATRLLPAAWVGATDAVVLLAAAAVGSRRGWHIAAPIIAGTALHLLAMGAVIALFFS